MAKLIPLRDLPYEARETEADARRDLREQGEDVLECAHYEIHMAEGCYSGTWPPTVGWVVTERAAQALAAGVTHTPGGSCHHRLSWSLESA